MYNTLIDFAYFYICRSWLEAAGIAQAACEWGPRKSGGAANCLPQGCFFLWFVFLCLLCLPKWLLAGDVVQECQEGARASSAEAWNDCIYSPIRFASFVVAGWNSGDRCRMSLRISTDQESGWGKLGNFPAASSLSQVQKKGQRRWYQYHVGDTMLEWK